MILREIVTNQTKQLAYQPGRQPQHKQQEPTSNAVIWCCCYSWSLSSFRNRSWPWSCNQRNQETHLVAIFRINHEKLKRKGCSPVLKTRLMSVCPIDSLDADKIPVATLQLTRCRSSTTINHYLSVPTTTSQYWPLLTIINHNESIQRSVIKTSRLETTQQKNKRNKYHWSRCRKSTSKWWSQNGFEFPMVAAYGELFRLRSILLRCDGPGDVRSLRSVSRSIVGICPAR